MRCDEGIAALLHKTTSAAKDVRREYQMQETCLGFFVSCFWRHKKQGRREADELVLG